MISLFWFFFCTDLFIYGNPLTGKKKKLNFCYHETLIFMLFSLCTKVLTVVCEARSFAFSLFQNKFETGA